MSRVDIADYLGLTTETVSRVLTEFRRRGLIGYASARDMVLRDRRALSALADGHETSSERERAGR